MNKRVVVIGGGTGSYVLLSGLKNYPVSLTAIVPVTDDGGSTGRLRDEFGFLPVGDMRQCLAALAPESSRLKQLLLYRFEKGIGLTGHTLGNLILTAMEDIVGNEPEAITAAAKLFRLKGEIYPVSEQLVKLVAEYSSGKTIASEHLIEGRRLTKGERIIKMYTRPEANISPGAKKALTQAEAIILAPGDLFNSIISSLVIKGTAKAIKNSPAKLIYVLNLMTLNSQTNYLTAKDHVDTIEAYAGRRVDAVIVNNQLIPAGIMAAYAKQGEYPVVDDIGADKRAIRRNLLAATTYQKPKSDLLKRSLLRHDPEKLAKVIIKCLDN